MIKQPPYESRKVNRTFYINERKRIEKINKALGDIDLTKGEEQTLLWIAGWEDDIVNHILSIIEKIVQKHDENNQMDKVTSE